MIDESTTATVTMDDCYLTVGELKKKIKDLPDDMKVVYQRIDDHYFADCDDGTDLGSSGWDIIKFNHSEPHFPDDYHEEAVRAFDAFPLKSLDKDEEYLFITAHY